MLKSILLSAVFVAGASTFALAAGEAMDSPMVHHHMLHHRHKSRVLANGRCNGTSYGTGARSCGTATGGPVGGLGSRN